MGLKAFLYELFLPKGYPDSVADEYWDYQIWDTMQQVTYFVNTVISSQAIMKFHGVGDPTKTPAEATALSVSRDALAESVSIFARVPPMTKRYKNNVAKYRLISEILNAAGHFMEILASILTHVALLLYGGPMVCNVSSAMSGATRARIMQHFAKIGNNADISLKESNQDKGGKIVGVLIGIFLLSFLGGSGVDENTVLIRSLIMFCCLSVLHIFGNVKAVRVLQVPVDAPPTADSSAATNDVPKRAGPVAFLEAMFLPPGYWQGSVAETYTRYQVFSAIRQMTVYPESVVMNMAFWSNVYGVGDASRTPLQAVMIDIFQTTVSAVVGLMSGMPMVTKRFDYSRQVWKLRSGILGSIGGIVKFLAALLPGAFGQTSLFWPLIVVSICISAFAGASGTMTNADIAKNWSRSPEVGLTDLSVTSSNQALLVKMASAVFCVGYLYGPGANYTMPLSINLIVYAVIAVINMATVYGQYRNMPSAPPVPIDGRNPGNAFAVTQPAVGELKSKSAPLEFVEPLLSQPAVRRAISDFAEVIDMNATRMESFNMYTPTRVI